MPQLFIKYSVYFIWPLFGFVQSIANKFKSKHDRYLLAIFCAFIGMNITMDSNIGDISRNQDVFLYSISKDFKFFVEFTKAWLRFDGSVSDKLGLQWVAFPVSRITSSTSAYFATLGLVYGLFYAKLIHMLLSMRTKHGIYTSIFIAFLLLFLFPTVAINQRFWIAGLIATYGIMVHLVKDNYWGLLWLLLAPAFHQGITIILFIYGVFLVTRRIPSFLLLVGLIPIAYVLGTDFEFLLNSTAAYMPAGVSDKLFRYSNEVSEAMVAGRESAVWYADTKGLLLVILSFVLTAIYFNRDKSDKLLADLLKLNIFLGAIALMFSNFSMGFRFFGIAAFFQIITIYLFLQRHNLNAITKPIFLFTSPIFVMLLVSYVPKFLQYLKPTLFVSNFLTGWFVGDLHSIWYYLDFYDG